MWFYSDGDIDLRLVARPYAEFSPQHSNDSSEITAFVPNRTTHRKYG